MSEQDSRRKRIFAGDRVAVGAEDQELNPAQASVVLGISRPLVVHRMDIGDLPFRYLGKHCGSACKKAPLSGVIGVQQGPLISMD